MESKRHLFEIINKVGCDRREYLEALFKYIPESVVKELIYCEIKKNQTIGCSLTEAAERVTSA